MFIVENLAATGKSHREATDDTSIYVFIVIEIILLMQFCFFKLYCKVL